jgi:hypothetical protein
VSFFPLFFIGEETTRERGISKLTTKLTGKLQEPVFELLEAVGGEVDGLEGEERGGKRREEERKEERG